MIVTEDTRRYTEHPSHYYLSRFIRGINVQIATLPLYDPLFVTLPTIYLTPIRVLTNDGQDITFPSIQKSILVFWKFQEKIRPELDELSIQNFNKMQVILRDLEIYGW